jgi:hypothetical protein
VCDLEVIGVPSILNLIRRVVSLQGCVPLEKKAVSFLIRGTIIIVIEVLAIFIRGSLIQ